MNEARKSAIETALEGITVRSTCNGLAVADDWYHFLWVVTLEYEGRTMQTEYKTGVALCEVRLGPMEQWEPYHHRKHVFENGRHYSSVTRELLEVRPIPPNDADVIYSIVDDAALGDMPFSEFCAKLYYAKDSCSAYLQCQKVMADLRKLLGREKLAQVMGALVDWRINLNEEAK